MELLGTTDLVSGSVQHQELPDSEKPEKMRTLLPYARGRETACMQVLPARDLWISWVDCR